MLYSSVWHTLISVSFNSRAISYIAVNECIVDLNKCLVVPEYHAIRML